MAEFRVISIGTLSSHPLWNERGEVRTGHATTTLITAGDSQILVNPSLPQQALVARMGERTNVRPEEITHVFLTSFDRTHRRALPQFDQAQWLISEAEREAASAALSMALSESREDAELVSMLRQDSAILERCEIAPDSIAKNVDLFPLPGVTAGTCGLLLSLPGMTVLICGDAIATVEHLHQGKVLPQCANIEQAQESFREAVQIGDVLVLGRDNVVLNPLRRL